MRAACRCLAAVAVLSSGACASHGREVFVRQGCVGCHTFRGAGGGMGPDLSDVAARRSAASIRAQITRPAAGNPASRMPAFDRLGWYDLHSLVAFLRSRG